MKELVFEGKERIPYQELSTIKHTMYISVENIREYFACSFDRAHVLVDNPIEIP